MLERYGHGGDLRTAAEAFGVPQDEFLDYSSNMNPLGPPPSVREALLHYADVIGQYPDPAIRGLRAKLAAYHGVTDDAVLVGNGAAELIDLVARVHGAGVTGLAVPCFGEYGDAVRKASGTVKAVQLNEEYGFEWQEEQVDEAVKAEAPFWLIGSPNNPTGRLVKPEYIRRLLRAGARVAVDEAFMDFVTDEETYSLVREAAVNKQLFVIRSMTKFYSIPGIRLGYIIGHPDEIARLRELQVPWSVNSLAQSIGEAVLGDNSYAEATRQWLAEERPWLSKALSSLDCTVIPGAANYMLFRLPEGKGLTAAELQERMGKQGILIRDGGKFEGLSGSYCRIAIKRRADNEKLIQVLRQCLASEVSERDDGIASNTSARGGESHKRQASTIMVQGTASDVGKSLLTAALCRIFKEDGLQTAPFKSQNMSLNSYVTWDGKEIGRAQGMQADACGVLATTDMNPILLKPTREMSSQVVVHGVPLRDYDAREYRERYLTEAEAVVREAIGRLRSSYDVVVLEGAGSPAEINLKDRDIVNMRMAAWADAPVLLVADIDRGGVFASVVGTLELLEPEERKRVAGIIINKFRGDVSLLRPGLDWLEKRTGKPVLGVLPYMRGLELEDEDSLSLDSQQWEQDRKDDIDDRYTLDIAVIRLPRIANFTDLDPLRFEPDVRVRFIEETEALGRPDVIILPGSKNTIEDLLWLEDTGLRSLVLEHVATGGFLVGICGGYEMLGERLLDPVGVESAVEAAGGLGMFPFDVTFSQVKRTVRVQGTARLYGVLRTAAGDTMRAETDGYPIDGYEIHMGEVTWHRYQEQPLLLREQVIGSELAGEGEAEPEADYAEGAVSPDGRVWGTFVHGILHNDDYRRGWLNEVRRARGWEPLSAELRFRERREAAFDRLAAEARAHLNIPAIRRIMGIDEGDEG
ncbi:cobyric acid synthase [Paenibacillus sp. GCM10023252]|uniref:cobyric acid synthase n=1 Tax=Paenibacillus sp. GCM10023252 TaxID=3252649 RepID=UPI0036207053